MKKRSRIKKLVGITLCQEKKKKKLHTKTVDIFHLGKAAIKNAFNNDVQSNLS